MHFCFVLYNFKVGRIRPQHWICITFLRVSVKLRWCRWETSKGKQWLSLMFLFLFIFSLWALGKHNFQNGLFNVIVLVSLNESFHLLNCLFVCLCMYDNMFKAKAKCSLNRQEGRLHVYTSQTGHKIENLYVEALAADLPNKVPQVWKLKPWHLRRWHCLQSHRLQD